MHLAKSWYVIHAKWEKINSKSIARRDRGHPSEGVKWHLFLLFSGIFDSCFGHFYIAGKKNKRRTWWTNIKVTGQEDR
jgi:hypothetical protein